MESSTQTVSLVIHDIPKHTGQELEIEKLTTDDICYVSRAFAHWLTVTVSSIFKLSSDITNTFITIVRYNDPEDSNLFTIEMTFKFNAIVSTLKSTDIAEISSTDAENIGDIISFFMKVNNGSIDQRRCKSIHKLIQTQLGGFVHVTDTATRLPLALNSAL